MRSLWDDGIAKAAAGLTSVEELTRVVTQSGSAQAEDLPTRTSLKLAPASLGDTRVGSLKTIGVPVLGSSVAGLDYLRSARLQSPAGLEAPDSQVRTKRDSPRLAGDPWCAVAATRRAVR